MQEGFFNYPETLLFYHINSLVLLALYYFHHIGSGPQVTSKAERLVFSRIHL